MKQFRKLQSMTLSDILEVKHLKMLYLWNGKSWRKNVWEIFVNFDICHRMMQLQKKHFVTLTSFLKVKDSNRDLPTVASNHSGATCTSKDSNRSLSTVANNHSGATCASTDSNWNSHKVVSAHSCLKCKLMHCSCRFAVSCSCRFASTCTAPAVALILLLLLLFYNNNINNNNNYYYWFYIPRSCGSTSERSAGSWF